MIKDWIKQNFVLALGLSLPLLLVVVFMAATVVPRMFATPPQYKLLFSINNYSENAKNYTVSYFVENNKLKALLKKEKGNTTFDQRRLMLFDPQQNSVIEINTDFPATILSDQTLLIKNTTQMKIDSNRVAPDGYFASDDDGWYGGGIVPELYGSGRYRNEPRIKKGAVSYRIPVQDYIGTYYYGPKTLFIGWVIEERK